MRIISSLLAMTALLVVSPQALLADENPALPGFDHSGSDQRAVEIADAVMKRLGGRSNWDSTRYITWRFFGKRLHVWDKWTGNLRFEDGELLVLMNIDSRTGRAWVANEEIVQADSLAAKLTRVHETWINDSYWLIMPYKLKDSGVTLKYVGREKTLDGLESDILDLTFRDVGVTPQNRYEVYVDAKEHLVRQWSFYREATDEAPAFTLSWNNWQPYGNIWLADDFGRSQHTDLAVFDALPSSVFERPEPIELPQSGKPSVSPGESQ